MNDETIQQLGKQRLLKCRTAGGAIGHWREFLACIRQRIRLVSQVQLLALVFSPKSSAKRSCSWATLSRRSAATSLTMLMSTGCSLLWKRKRSTPVDSEPHSWEECKAIRDKRERFIC
jgi:hypothetical protein